MTRPFSVVAAIAVFIGATCAFSQTTPASASTSAPAIFGVDELMEIDPIPRTRVVVRGVVSSLDEKQRRLGLIDEAEFQRCRVTTCAALILPVSWTGAMPSVASSVRAHGKIEDVDGKLVFVADHLAVTKAQSGKR